MPPEIVDVVKIVHNPFASGFLIPYVLCVHGQRRKDGGCIHPIEELYRLKYSHRFIVSNDFKTAQKRQGNAGLGMEGL